MLERQDDGAEELKDLNSSSKMVFEKIIAYTNGWNLGRRDSGIIYLDGVTPPCQARVDHAASSGNNNLHAGTAHQQFLQTIKEQDEGESRRDCGLTRVDRSLRESSSTSSDEESDPLPFKTSESDENAVDSGSISGDSRGKASSGYSSNDDSGEVSRKSSSESYTSDDTGLAETTGPGNKVMISSPIPNNNNSLPKKVSMEELELLKKLEAANRLIETDAKSTNSLSCQSGHSRRSSDTSQVSFTSMSQTSMASGTGSATPAATLAQDGNNGSQNGTEISIEDLWTLWGKIVNEWEIWSKKKQPEVKELVRRGIPHHFRGMAWQLLCGAHESRDKDKYSAYMKSQSACEKVIRRDIARTYPEHDFFKKKNGVGQEALFNVIKAYSIHDREVGYCQGTAFIVGLLLMQMPEEDSFAVLVRIMQDYRMREMFKPSMAELGLCMYQMDMLVQEHVPDLSAHFHSQAVHTNLYASSWFLTLFTTSLPISLSSRIMDCFLLDGIEVIFRLALSLLILGKPDLLVLDMEGVLRYFQKEMPVKFEADPEEVMTVAFSLKINQKKMKKMEKEYTTMKTKEKEDEIELKRLRTENRLLRQKVDMLEQESCNLADRLIQGQVNRAEVDEDTFAIKRELAAIKQHDIDTSGQLDSARERIRKLSDIVDRTAMQEALSNREEEVSLKSEIIRQKEEMIVCLQDELIKVRLAEAENAETTRDLNSRVSELEEEIKKLREAVPDNDVASLQEELAAAKLREAEANLALKELKSSVAEINAMWQMHLKRKDSEVEGSSSTPVAHVPSTPKRILGSLLDGKSEVSRLEEELVTLRIAEVEAQSELRCQRLKVMELETQNQVISNQLKRKNDELSKIREALDVKNLNEYKLQCQLREAQRKYGDLESRMKEDILLARIRDAENTQSMAELTQKISCLEYKNQEMLTEGDLATSINQSDKVRELQDKVAHLRAQVTRLSLVNSKLSKSLSMHNLAASFSAGTSECSSPAATPSICRSRSPSQSSLKLNLPASLITMNSSPSSMTNSVTSLNN